MSTFGPGAGVLANTTLIIELVKKLADKGILDDEDWRDVLNRSFSQLQSHDEGEEAIKFIMNIAGLDQAK